MYVVHTYMHTYMYILCALAPSKPSCIYKDQFKCIRTYMCSILHNPAPLRSKLDFYTFTTTKFTSEISTLRIATQTLSRDGPTRGNRQPL